MFGNLGTIWAEIGLDTTKLDMGVAKASASMTGLTASASGIGKAMAGVGIGIGLVGGAITVASIKMAADFDSSMRKVWSLTTESEAVFKSWKKEVLDLSANLPQSADEMAQAFYWVKSNMPDATNADQLKTLEIAARGAVGGVAELADTTQALTQAQNAYREQDPERYMNVMLKTVERGSITLQDFVNNQGKYVGSAALANISIEETSAAMATLTRNAIPADTAAMAINQTIMSFLKPTTEATDAANKYGIELSLAALRSKGLGAAMMEIAQKIPDDELTKLFPNIRALKAVFPLAGIAAEDFAHDIGLMGGELDNLDRMYEKNLGTQEKWAIAIGKLKNKMIEFGDKILPTVEKVIEALGRIFDGKNETFNSLVSVLKTITGLAWKLRTPIMLVGAAFLTWKIATGIEAAILGIKAVLLGLPAAAAGGTAAVATAGGAAGTTWVGAFIAKAMAGFAAGGFVIPIPKDVTTASGKKTALTGTGGSLGLEKSAADSLQAMLRLRDRIEKEEPKVSAAMKKVIRSVLKEIEKKPEGERDVGAMSAILDEIAKGDKKLKPVVDRLRSSLVAGFAGGGSDAGAKAATALEDSFDPDLVDNANQAIVDLKEALLGSSPEIKAAVDKMLEQAFQAGDQASGLTQDTINHLKSDLPEYNQLGRDMVGQTALGMLNNQGVTGAAAVTLAQTIANKVATGDGGSTGSEAGDTVMADLVASLGGNAGAVASAGSGVGKKFMYGVQSGAASVVASVGWNMMSSLISTVTGFPIPTVTIPVAISVNPTFKKPADAGKYIMNQLGKGISSSPQSITIAAGIAALTDAQKRALNATNVLTGAFGAWGAEMDALPFREVEEGIVAVTQGNWAALGVWRQIRGELDLSTATLKKYQDQLEESEKRVDSLSRREQKLNDSIAARQQRMNDLTGMRLKGETAADDKTFAFQQKINKLELARLKAIDAGKYNEAAKLAAEKKRLEKQMEIHELETSTTYDPQRREIEKVTDASRKQEMTLKDIIAEIKKTQRALEVETKQRDRISAVIKKERDAQWLLKIEIDNTSKVVDDLRSRVDVMADHFVTRLHEIRAAAEEAAAAVGGIAGGGVDVAGGSRILAPVGVSGGGSSSSSVSSTTTNIFNIDHLHTQATDGESLMRDLRNYSLRRQVS